MKYSTIVDKSDESLLMIIETAKNFDENKYLQGIYECRFKKEKIMSFTEVVKECHAKLRREYLALADFAVKFNKMYATDNNKCFETAEHLFNRIRSSISGTKRIYKKFCKVSRKKWVENADRPVEKSIFKRSALAKALYTEDMFGMVSYDECVNILYEELEGFFKDLVVGLALCHMIIQEEAAIRSAPERCMELYRQCCDEAEQSARLLVKTMKENRVERVSQDEFQERRKKARSLQEFVCENFHEMNLSEFQIHVVSELLHKGQANGLTEIETALWPSGNERIKDIRLIIAHFDELESEGQKGKLDGKAVTTFMKWCGVGEGKEKLFVEDYFNKEYKGELATLKANSVNTAKNKMMLGKVKFDADAFEQSIEDLIQKYSSGNIFVLKSAVNF